MPRRGRRYAVDNDVLEGGMKAKKVFQDLLASVVLVLALVACRGVEVAGVGYSHGVHGV